MVLINGVLFLSIKKIYFYLLAHLLTNSIYKEMVLNLENYTKFCQGAFLIIVFVKKLIKKG